MTVANELTLTNNTFESIARKGFMLLHLHSVRVVGNKFSRMEAEAFFEPTVAAQQTWSVLRFSDNVFRQHWLPVVRLQRTTVETDVTGNQFVGSCGCGPWRFVAASDHDEGNGTAASDGVHDNEFANWNYCTADAAAARCANLTATGDADMKFRIGDFMMAAGCDVDTAIYDRCIKDGSAVNGTVGGFRFLGDAFTPAAERGVITTVVLLVLCGFGAVCAVSAVTWLNARGYFIKLRSLLTSSGTGEDGGRGGGDDGLARTVSAHSLSPISVHEYAKIQPQSTVVQMIAYQDRSTQTTPEELTYEMIQELRDKLDDPEDYAEARIMIEHLYDLIHVEETGNWYATGGGLDDMTSTITTKAVTVGPGHGRGRDVKSVGTSAPSSLERLRPPKFKVDTATGPPQRYPWPQQQPRLPADYRPSSVVEYVDPADLLHGDDTGSDDDGVGIYCELADLRASIYDRPLHPKKPRVRTRTPPPPPPPIPVKPTEV